MGHVVAFPKVNNVGNEEGFWYHLRRVPYWRHGLSRLAVIGLRFYKDLLRFGREPAVTKRFRAFRERFIPEEDSSIGELAQRYDCIVMGSDQIWNTIMLDNDEPLFLAEAIPSGIPLIAYAASCGDRPLADVKLKRLAAQLDRFKGVSVREPFARDMVQKYWSGTIAITVDPTLLLTAQDYLPLMAQVPPHPRPYIYVYLLYPSDTILSLAHQFAKRHGYDVVVTVAYAPKRSEGSWPYQVGCTPDQMVSLIAHAEGVIAASFHGTVLSLIFNKPVVSLGVKSMGLGLRQRHLLESIGLSDWFVSDDKDFASVERVLSSHLPDEANDKIRTLRVASQEWLQGRLSI